MRRVLRLPNAEDRAGDTFSQGVDAAVGLIAVMAAVAEQAAFDAERGDGQAAHWLAFIAGDAADEPGLPAVLLDEAAPAGELLPGPWWATRGHTLGPSAKGRRSAA